MTYAEYVEAVIEEMGPDGVRRGIEDLRTRAIRDSVVDMQRFIRAYRSGHSTRYDEGDLEEKGYAHLGILPAQSKPKALYIISTGETVEEGTTDNPNIVRNRLDYVGWENRQHMVSDRWGAQNYQYSISPFSTQFMVHPLVNDETYLLIVWDGLKMAFVDGDIVPWPEWAAEASAAYVKWRIVSRIDKRPDLARDEYAAYVLKRLSLYREQQESQSADGKDEEYAGGEVNPPVPTILANFGGQDIPFLRLVTDYTGSSTSLDAIPTAGLTVPFTIEIMIGGVVQQWQLQSSTAATAPGIRRPLDYDGATNAKVWIQTS